MDSFFKHKTEQWNQRSVSLDRVTDTSLEDILAHHSLELTDSIETVLVLGVGRGAAIRSLVERGKTVYSTDISGRLVKVGLEFGASKSVLSSEINSLPPVDLALCHLVLQHNIEPEVERLINDVNLTSNGIGSYQYSTLAPDSQMTKVMIYDFNEGELNVYSTERMGKIVSRTNKKLIENIPSLKWREELFSWDWNVLRFANR